MTEKKPCAALGEDAACNSCNGLASGWAWFPRLRKALHPRAWGWARGKEHRVLLGSEPPIPHPAGSGTRNPGRVLSTEPGWAFVTVL